ncbi:MAG: GDP-perosamine synthase [Alphaproteobacteria bacterium MarineAlpha5_Bin8]|mgnify:FL=1|nr:MAG: GDP-perosamine synthase [Alphaproteobacteria bacterium MarineAlpha5_Bin8]PPR54154.1 MAG: GDP-perosamine synthase [Alphaproteobacteria bacterium MarineAlpha5_Bin6]
MINKNILFNKTIKHFNFLKTNKDFSELISKNLPMKEKKNILLTLNLDHDILNIKKFINSEHLLWAKKSNNIIFFSLKSNLNIGIILGVSIDKNLDLTFSILGTNKNINEVSDTLTCVIKYFREVIYLNNYIFDKTFSRNTILKIQSDKIFKRKKNILTAGPSVSLLEIASTNNASRYGWNAKSQEYIKKFEKQFAKYLGVKHAIATSSCTGALQIALLASGVNSNDEVIVPDLTWVASATAVRDIGAKPVFADVELDSWNIDANSVLKKINSKTKAIIIVHLYGNPARMDKIIKIANKENIKVIEDAAPAVGAEWKGKKCGTFGDFAAFSFQGAKLLVAGEGGMLVTNNTSLYKRAYKISNQGRSSKKQFWIDTKGLKFKISNIQAAFGYAQILRVHEQIAMKRRIFNWYYENLKNLECINLHHEVKNAKSIYWMTSFMINEKSDIKRDKVIKELKKFGIDTRPVFPSISQYPIWHKTFLSQKNSLLISRNSINLPSGIGLTKKDVDYISKVLIKILKRQ